MVPSGNVTNADTHRLQKPEPLFFLLAGFIITGILLWASHHDSQEVRNFYVPHTLRIFPLYYCALLALVLLGRQVSPLQFHSVIVYEGIMRGIDHHQADMFSYVSPEQRVRKDHPVPVVRAITDEILDSMSALFDVMYAQCGWP